MPLMKSDDNIYQKDYLFMSKMPKNIEFSTTVSILLIVWTIIVFLPYLVNERVNAQTYNNVIIFPDVNVTNNNNQNASLDYEFLLLGNNSQNPLEVKNPDFGLNQPFVKLIEGQKYVVAPQNDQDIPYSSISIKLAQVQFVSPDVTNLTDADPENPDDMTLVAPIELAHSAGGNNASFVMPSNIPPGNYILYAYIQYPNGITGVFSNLATVSKG
jgi:hypothetical protein